MRETVMVQVGVGDDQSREFRGRARVEPIDIRQDTFRAERVARTSHGAARPLAAVRLGERHAGVEKKPVTVGGPQLHTRTADLFGTSVDG